MESKLDQRIWIYSELFYPEQTSTAFIMSKIANRLAMKYDVNVICGEASYDKGKQLNFELNKSIHLKRLKSLKANKDSTIQRVLKFIVISTQFFLHLLFHVKSGDKVFTVTNPAPFLVFISMFKLFKNFEAVLLVHDVFPENTFSGGFVKNNRSILYRILKSIFDWAYSKFDTIIVLGRDMKEIVSKKLKNKSVKSHIFVVENWGELDSITTQNRENKNDKIKFQFAGNLGSIQGLDLLIEIIREVNNPKLIFEFIGSGKMLDFLIDFVKKHELSNVYFKGNYSREEQNIVLNDTDVSIVSLSENMYGLGVPSKTYNILAAGKPIFYIGDKNSEIDLLIREHNIGFSFAPNEKKGIISFLNTINETNLIEFQNKGKIARIIVEKYYTEDAILSKFDKII